MALKKKPVTGMKDMLPKEMEIRDYCISVIKKTYAQFGFQSIETPCVEHIENLCSKQGGENYGDCYLDHHFSPVYIFFNALYFSRCPIIAVLTNPMLSKSAKISAA